MSNTCYIFGAGEYPPLPLSIDSDDYIIAADGGYRQLDSMGITPDLLMGDFDSIDKPDFPNIVEFNSKKNDTDMLIAIKRGLSLGYKTFKLYGGTGGRFDHTMANIQCLAYIAHRGGIGYLYGKRYTLTAITDSSMPFDSSYRGYISVFSLTNQSTGVYLTGLKYPLTDHTLTNDFPLGVSNEFTGNPSCVTVKSGTLLICIENQ